MILFNKYFLFQIMPARVLLQFKIFGQKSRVDNNRARLNRNVWPPNDCKRIKRSSFGVWIRHDAMHRIVTFYSSIDR